MKKRPRSKHGSAFKTKVALKSFTAPGSSEFSFGTTKPNLARPVIEGHPVNNRNEFLMAACSISL